MRWAEDHAVAEVLELESFDEDDLCVALQWLQAEQARIEKTWLRPSRPIFLRKAGRTDGHAAVTMLALKLTRRLRERVAPLGLTSEDAVARLAGVRLVGLGPEAHNLWCLPDSMPSAQQEILAVLSTLGSPLLSVKNRSNAASNQS